MRNIHLETGREYALENLFSGKNRIIIPDLQRDYCWGDKAYDKNGKPHELVSGFIDSLLDLYRKNRSGKFVLGLIYGYEYPQYHIQLCDGQQRITTLFLLLGMLNRKTNGSFRKYLISDFELNEDDKEPYLQYAIRESTLYFLSDLVCEFFLNNTLSIDNISKQDWYFEEYNLDASIISMIEALKLIDKKFQEQTDLDFADFGNFIVHDLQMLYYDMGNRAHGEETFVVINTTGEPLTATENLKPVFVNRQPLADQQKASELWEEWETFFWLHRKSNNSKTNDTADKGFLEFFRWLVLLTATDKETFKNIAKGEIVNIDNLNLQDIQQYFEVVKFAFEHPDIFLNDIKLLAPDEISQINWFRILPVIEYIKRFGKDNIRHIIRVKQFFNNMARSGNVGRAIAELLPQAIRIIKELPSPDIASITSITGVSKQLLTDEEELKFNIYQQTINREEVENSLWKEEAHKVWDGEIMSILEWSGGCNFKLDLFKKYSKAFSILFHGNMDYEKLDETRRALLTRELNGYPRVFKGNTNYSFCWNYSDWKILINDNIEKFKEFFDELLDKDEKAIYSEIDEMIDKNSSEKDYDEFVKISELLEFCEQKKIQWDGQKGWVLIARDRRTGAHANLKTYRLHLDLQNNKLWNEEIWKSNFYPYDGGCTYIDDKSRDIAIDMYFERNIDGIDTYKILLFKRIARKEGKEELLPIAESCNLEWSQVPADNYYRYESRQLTKEDFVETLQQILNKIELIFPND